MSLRTRIYAQFLLAVLPLIVLVGWQGLARDDMPERVSAALMRYDFALEAETSFKDFLNGVSDAIDSGRLGDRGLDALRKSASRLASLSSVSPDDGALATRVNALADSLARDASVKALLPLKGEVQALREAILESSGAKREALAALVRESQERVRHRQRVLAWAGIGSVALLVFMAFVQRRVVANIV
ncbi:MAG TPA: hypothetical protein VF038_06605, partial [Usitatibacter sp.]